MTFIQSHLLSKSVLAINGGSNNHRSQKTPVNNQRSSTTLHHVTPPGSESETRAVFGCSCCKFPLSLQTRWGAQLQSCREGERSGKVARWAEFQKEKKYIFGALPLCHIKMRFGSIKTSRCWSARRQINVDVHVIIFQNNHAVFISCWLHALPPFNCALFYNKLNSAQSRGGRTRLDGEQKCARRIELPLPLQDYWKGTAARPSHGTRSHTKLAAADRLILLWSHGSGRSSGAVGQPASQPAAGLGGTQMTSCVCELRTRRRPDGAGEKLPAAAV